MNGIGREQAIGVLFADLDGIQVRTEAVKHLGAVSILQNPEDYGLTYAIARDLDHSVPAPFERKVAGNLPAGNRIAITASETLDSSGGHVSTHYVFTAMRR